MSIYIRMSDKNYKLPESLTLGRGSPFHIKDRSFARAHARIIQKKNKFYIKDLGSEAGTLINGKKLTDRKLHEITLTDQIQMGTIALELIDKLPDEECVVVKKFLTTGEHSTSYALWFFILAFAGLTASSMDATSFTDQVVHFAVAAGIPTLLIVLFRKFWVHSHLVKEINHSKDGFTFHKENDQNFSCKFSEITEYQIHGKFVLLTAFGMKQFFVMPYMDERLIQTLERMCKDRGYIVGPKEILCYRMPTLLLGLAFLFLQNSESALLSQALAAGAFIGMLSLLAMMLSPDLRRNWFLPQEHDMGSGRIFLALSAILAYSVWTLPGHYNHSQDIQTSLKKITHCRVVSPAGCDKLDYAALKPGSIELPDRIVVREACAAGNRGACGLSQHWPSRSLASETK